MALWRTGAAIAARPLIQLRLSSLPLANAPHPSPARGEGEFYWIAQSVPSQRLLQHFVVDVAAGADDDDALGGLGRAALQGGGERDGAAGLHHQLHPARGEGDGGQRLLVGGGQAA